MKKSSLLFSLTLAIMIIISSLSCKQPKMDDKNSVATQSACILKTNMRKLWEDHVIWTRNVILCLTDGLPGTDQAVKRLLQNQVDIGNAFKPYYGEEYGNELTKLLYIHINTSAEVVKAAKAGDKVSFEKANKIWYANADDLSEFLCKVNPNLSLEDMKMMMKDHLKITTDEAEQRINMNYDADVLAFHKIQTEILIMADVFSAGITKQFPEKFTTDFVK
ncbi:MAG: glycosyltransferase [Bacteroidia bacterium]